MYYPLVGERVWISGCRDEYIVERADYTASLAAIALVADRNVLLEKISFRLLYAHFEFEAALAGVAARPAVEELLRCSQLCLHQSRVFIRDVREITLSTLATIRRTQTLISQIDRDIARWKACGYVQEPNQITTP